MMYLFDDNQYNQMSKNYSLDVLEHLLNFSNFITHVDKPLDDTRLNEIIQNARAIFIHDSFPPKNFKERVCYMAKEENLPLIVFTGGEAATIWDKNNDNVISKMKKDRFYHYLVTFLERQKYNREKPIQVREFIYGHNYEIEKSLIIQDRLGLLLRGNSNNFQYESSFMGGTEEYKDLKELFYFLYGETCDEEFARFDDKYLEKSCSAKELFLDIKFIVSQIITKYEQ